MEQSSSLAYSTVTECSALMMVQLEKSGSFEQCKLTIDRKRQQLEFQMYSSRKKSAEIKTEPSIIINTGSITDVHKKKIGTAHPHCFEIVCSDRSYRFSLGSQQELDTWIQDIMTASSNCELRAFRRRDSSTQKKTVQGDAGGGYPRLESMIGGYKVEVIGGVVHRIPLESKESKTPATKRKQNKDNKIPTFNSSPKISPQNGEHRIIPRASSDNDLYSASGGLRRSVSYGSSITNTATDFTNRSDNNSNPPSIPHFSTNPNGEAGKVTLRQKVVRSNSDGSRFTRTEAGIKIIRSGYCVKQSRSLTKAWKRYFMEFDPYEICFYNNDYKKKLIKTIKCDETIKDVKKSDSTKIKDRDNLMEIVMKSKKVFIQFDTPEELSGWIDALRSQLKFSCRTYL